MATLYERALSRRSSTDLIATANAVGRRACIAAALALSAWANASPHEVPRAATAPHAEAALSPAPPPLAATAAPTLAYHRTELRTEVAGPDRWVHASDVFELHNETDATWVYLGFGASRPLANLCTWVDGEWQPCTFHVCITGFTDQLLEPGERIEFSKSSTGRESIGELELWRRDGTARWTIQSARYTPPELVFEGRSNRDRDLPCLPRSMFARRAPSPCAAAGVDPSPAVNDAVLPRLRYLRTQVESDGEIDLAWDLFELVNTTDRTWTYREVPGAPRDVWMEARFERTWSREARFIGCGTCFEHAATTHLAPGERIEFTRTSVGGVSRGSIELCAEGGEQPVVLTSPEHLPSEYWMDGVSRRYQGVSGPQPDGRHRYC